MQLKSKNLCIRPNRHSVILLWTFFAILATWFTMTFGLKLQHVKDQYCINEAALLLRAQSWPWSSLMNANIKTKKNPPTSIRVVRCSGKEFRCSVVLRYNLPKRKKFKVKPSNIWLFLTISAYCRQSYSLNSHKLLFLRWTTKALLYNFKKEKLQKIFFIVFFV